MFVNELDSLREWSKENMAMRGRKRRSLTDLQRMQSNVKNDAENLWGIMKIFFRRYFPETSDGFLMMGIGERRTFFGRYKLYGFLSEDVEDMLDPVYHWDLEFPCAVPKFFTMLQPFEQLKYPKETFTSLRKLAAENGIRSTKLHLLYHKVFSSFELNGYAFYYAEEKFIKQHPYVSGTNGMFSLKKGEFTSL